MFTCGKGCKHTVFLLSELHRQQEDRQQEDRQQAAGRQAAPPELCAQFVHMAHSFTTRALCTICSQ